MTKHTTDHSHGSFRFEQDLPSFWLWNGMQYAPGGRSCSGVDCIVRRSRRWTAFFFGRGRHGEYRATISVRAPLPIGEVELPRGLPAAKWSAPFCKVWTDDCLECSGSALEMEVLCKDRKMVACASSRVRCLEIDLHVAPLYCAEVSDECQTLAFRGGPDGSRADASGNNCGDFPTKSTVPERAPENWKCETFQAQQEECVRNGAPLTVCRREGAAAASGALVRLKTMLRESESLRK
jgi:hypothetical protein